MTVFEVLTKDGKLEASIVLAGVDSINRTKDGDGTEIHSRGGRCVVLNSIPIEKVAQALRDAP